MANCTHCGHPLRPGKPFCGNCGRPVAVQTPAVPKPSPAKKGHPILKLALLGLAIWGGVTLYQQYGEDMSPAPDLTGTNWRVSGTFRGGEREMGYYQFQSARPLGALQVGIKDSAADSVYAVLSGTYTGRKLTFRFTGPNGNMSVDATLDSTGRELRGTAELSELGSSGQDLGSMQCAIRAVRVD
jgi:hypothetical protein